MKFSMTLAALCVGVASVASVGSALAATTTTEPAVKIWVGSKTPPPQTPAATRKEAAAMLAQARQDCRKHGDRDAQRSCVSNAQHEYKQMMASADEGTSKTRAD